MATGNTCSGRAVAEVVRIGAVGHRGDGVAETPNGLVYVPFTLPGELVAIERQGERGRVLELIEASPERAAPLCRHFGACGGCGLQMMTLAETRRWKRQLVADALAGQSLAAEVAETVGVDAASRRRAVLTALRAGNKLLLGYNERVSNRLVDLDHCPVLVPALAERLSPMRALLALFVAARKPARVTVLATRNGLDVDVRDAPAPSRRVLAELVSLAERAGVARLTVGGETVATFAEPALDIAGVPVVPPPGAFVQASTEAETAMTALVTKRFAGARRVADLFAGVGTFALALAPGSQVKAVESSRPALDALAAAAHRAEGLKRIETERRDLFSFPLGPAELKAFDGVVFDPPRAGAKAQAAMLAASAVPRIAAVSCNPASFARDARILADGGYRLERVVPVDQFVYSAEVEVVGLFRR